MSDKEILQKIKSNKGQSFIEFMLLLFSLVSMSYILVNSMGNLMSKRWQALVVIVTAPDVEKALSHKANVKFRP